MLILISVIEFPIKLWEVISSNASIVIDFIVDAFKLIFRISTYIFNISIFLPFPINLLLIFSTSFVISKIVYNIVRGVK